MLKRPPPFAAAILAAFPLLSLADATIYGKVNVSIDYLDVDENAAWNRPAVGAPSFDVLSFIDDGNQALNDAGYTAALPPPRELDTVIGDLLFGTIPFESLDPALRQQIFGAVDNALTPGRAFRGWDLNANGRGNRLGIRGSEDLGEGLKAIYQIELAIPITDTDDEFANADPGRIGMRNSYLGLAIDWGTLLVGRHDTPTKMSTSRLDLFADTLADYNYTVGFDDVRADNTILYISPSFHGLQVAGALIPTGGATIGGGPNPDADSIAAGWSVAVNYERGPFFASAAYEVLGSELWALQDGAYDMIHAVFADDETKWRLGLGLLDWNGFTLSGIYESRENVLGMPVDASADLWQVQTGYAFGNNMIKAMYGSYDRDTGEDDDDDLVDAIRGLADGDRNSWAIAFDHNFSKRTRAYVVYTDVDDDDEVISPSWTGFSLGMIHSF